MFLAGHRNIKVCTGGGRGFDFLLNISPVHPCCDHPHYSMHINETKKLQASLVSSASPIFTLLSNFVFSSPFYTFRDLDFCSLLILQSLLSK